MHVIAKKRALAGSLTVGQSYTKNLLRKLFEWSFPQPQLLFFLSSDMSFISLHLQNDHQSVTDRAACTPLVLHDLLEEKRDTENYVCSAPSGMVGSWNSSQSFNWCCVFLSGHWHYTSEKFLFWFCCPDAKMNMRDLPNMSTSGQMQRKQTTVVNECLTWTPKGPNSTNLS